MLAGVKRLQIMIEEEMDVTLEREAARRGCSKAALVREAVADRFKPLPPIEEDPIWKMAGSVSWEVDPNESIDDVIYGPISHGSQ